MIRKRDFFPGNRRLLAGLLLCWLVSVWSASAEWDGADADPLRDQFGVPGALADHDAAIQLAIVVSAKRLRRIKPWEEAVRADFADLPLLRVADVPRSAPTDYDQVAETLRKRLPEDVNVLIDLSGEWAVRYGLDVSHPTVLVFDAAGNLVGRYEGMFKRSLYEPLRNQLIELLEFQPP